MKIEAINVKTKCDNGACQHLAEYVIRREDTPRELSLCLCAGCIADIIKLYNEYEAGQAAPKEKDSLQKKSRSNKQY